MGARIVTPEHKHHSMRILDDRREGELLVVGRSKRNVYLWAGKDGNSCVTFSGVKTLRALANRILAIVGDDE